MANLIKKFSVFLKTLIKSYRTYHRKKRGSMREFDFESTISIQEDIKTKYNYDGPLLKIYTENKKHLIHKWHHYLPIYDRYFNHMRGRHIRFLEIGVSEGGSLQMWREYLGDSATIYGIDINPNCARLGSIAAEIRIGSQIDERFLTSVVAEMGGIDVVLDDGSHQMKHLIKSLRTLFPLLNNGGLYVIEDLQTAYWKRFGGGYTSKDNFFNRTRDIIDDMHSWYHVKKIKEPSISKQCSGVHIHDSIVIFEKNNVYKPVHSKVS